MGKPHGVFIRISRGLHYKAKESSQEDRATLRSHEKTLRSLWEDPEISMEGQGEIP